MLEQTHTDWRWILVFTHSFWFCECLTWGFITNSLTEWVCLCTQRFLAEMVIRKPIRLRWTWVHWFEAKQKDGHGCWFFFFFFSRRLLLSSSSSYQVSMFRRNMKDRPTTLSRKCSALASTMIDHSNKRGCMQRKWKGKGFIRPISQRNNRFDSFNCTPFFGPFWSFYFTLAVWSASIRPFRIWSTVTITIIIIIVDVVRQLFWANDCEAIDLQ